jgi:hypothetical protein
MASVVILVIVLFLICEKVVSAMSEHMKFLMSLKHLFLFFLIFSRERGRICWRSGEGRCCEEIRFKIHYIDGFIFVWIYDCITIYVGENVFSLDI